MSRVAVWPENPVIGILRGLPPEDAPRVAGSLVARGIRVLEVPLTDDHSYRSIEALVATVNDGIVIGAGTVLTPLQVRRAADCGSQLIVSPNLDGEVVEETAAAGLLSCPGVFTPTEILRALDLGVDVVKLFPADVVGPHGLRAVGVVLPAGVGVVPVGGVQSGAMRGWRQAGAWGVGLGTALYTPERRLDEIECRAERLSDEWVKAVESSDHVEGPSRGTGGALRGR